MGLHGLGGQGIYRLEDFEASRRERGGFVRCGRIASTQGRGNRRKGARREPGTFGDFRKLLERKDVDAV